MTTDTMIVDVSQDWSTACDVQQRFMRYTAPTQDAFSYGAHCRQLRALGGDCYDFMPLPHDRLAFTIGDASGKSLPAALMIANVQSSLRTAAFFAGDDPAAVLSAVNHQLHTSSLADRFVTSFYGVFDPATRVLRYANAGHNPPMVIRQDGSIIRLDTAGLPLGVFPYSTYDLCALQLLPGDAVIGYTDGVIEALNPLGEEWGEERVMNAAIESKAKEAHELVGAIFTSLDEFSLGRQTDDATVLVLLLH